MYIGTGDRDAADAPGLGVLWTANGGKTWTARNSGISNLTINKMVMHPRNSAILIIATNSGIYRSVNSGLSWTRTSIISNFTDVVMHPNNPQLVYATEWGLFYRSTDNGQSWTQITSGLPTSSYRGQIAVSKANTNYVYFVTSPFTNFQGLYRSADSGLTFSTRSTSPNILGYYDGTSGTSDLNTGQGWYDLDIAADPKNAEVVYVGGINIWRSTNGGTNWTQVAHWLGQYNAEDVHADHHALEFNITDNKLYSGHDGGIHFTINRGSRWVNISNGLQNSQIYRIAHAKNNEFINAQGYQDNGSSQTAKDEFFTYYGGDGMDCQVDPADANVVYGSYVYGRIYRATDKNNVVTVGANGTGGINESGNWLSPFILQEGQTATMFAGYQNVWRTTAVKTGAPPSWTRITSSLGGIRHLENSPARNAMLYLLETNGNMRRTGNANAASVSWVNLGSGPGGVRWIEAHHKDSNRVYCVNGSSLYRSTNKGSTWTLISTPSGAGALNTCFIDSSSKTELIYLGTERGVYVWDSLGNQTVNYNNSFPVWSDVTDIDIWYSPRRREESKIIVSTYGSGVWRSNLYNPGTQKPKSSFYAFDSILTNGGKIRLYEKIAGSASSLVWKITPYHFSYTDGTDSTSYTPTVQFNKNGLYTVRLISTNCQGSDTFTKESWIKVFDKPATAVCRNTTTYSTQSYGIGLLRFSLADNSNETGGYFDDGEHVDFTGNKVFRLKPGTSYTLTAKTGPYNGEYLRMFIDYNGDGRFQNFRGEVTASTLNTTGTKTLSFTTPSAPTKKNVGLRFRLLSDFSVIDTNACRNLNYGQGEDYAFVFDMPVPYFTANKLSACTGETITFRDTSEGLADRWEWDFGTGASPRTAQGQGPHQVSYTTTGSKSVRLRINGKDSVRKNAYVTINTAPDPIVVIKNGSSAGCQGRNITLVLRNRNAVPAVYQWQKDGVNLSGKTDSLLILNNLTLADSGVYTGVLINGSCRAASTGMKVMVYPRPKAGFSINNNNQCLKNNQFTFTNSSNIAAGSLTYNWSFGDGTTSATTSPVKNYSAAGSYSVRLIAISNNNCRDTVSAAATVNNNPTASFSLNSTSQCLRGNNFITTNNSSGASSYAWSFGDGTTSTATAPTKTYSVAGNYSIRLIANNAGNCRDTSMMSLTVFPRADIRFSVNDSDQCIKGNNFVFTNNSSISGGTLSYNWQFGDGTTSIANSPSKKYSATGNFTVRLTGISDKGCRDTFQKAVVIYSNPTAGFSVNNSAQCLKGNSFVLTNSSSSASSYAWSFGDGTTSTATAPTKTYSVAGNYSIRLIAFNSNSCPDTLSRTVQVYAQPTASFSLNNANQCLRGNNFITTNNSSGASSYLWSFGDATSSTATAPAKTYNAAGSYIIRLIATSANNCRDTSNISINVYPRASIRFSVNDSDQCLSGNNFVFTNNSSLTGGTLTYDWQFGDATSSTATSPSKNYTAAGFYLCRLVGITDKGCRDTANKPIRVYATPKAAYLLTRANPQCLRGNLFSFTNTSTSADGSLSYLWTFGNGGSTAAVSPTVSYNTFGDFPVKLRVTSSFGCRDSTTQTMSVKANPRSLFTINDSDQCLSGNRFTFSNQSSIPSGSISSRLWNYGDATTSSLPAPDKAYTNKGFYSISLISISDWGCRDTFVRRIRIYDQPKISFSINSANQCLKGNLFECYNNSSSADGTLTYRWKFGDGNSTAIKDPVHRYIGSGAYQLTLVGTSSFGCSDSNTAVMNVWPQAIVRFAANDSDQCQRGNVFNFINNTGISSGSVSFLWNFGDGSFSASANPLKSYNAHGIFPVTLTTVSDKVCRDTLKKSIRIYAMPNAGFSLTPNEACLEGNRFSPSNSSGIAEGTFTIDWKNGDGSVSSVNPHSHSYAQAGTYTMRQVLKSNFGCMDSTERQLLVHPMPKAAFTITPGDLCEGEIAYGSNLSSISSGTLQYNWNFGNGVIRNGDTASIAYSKYGNYVIQLAAMSNKSCTDTAQYLMKVASVPVSAFTVSPNPACAVQQPVAFNNSSTNADGNTLSSLWNMGDGNSYTLSNPNHTYASSGLYTAKLQVNNGKCMDVAQVQMNVVPNVSAAFSAEAITKETYALRASDTAMPGYLYLWDYGDNGSDTGAATRHTFRENGSYQTRLYVENSLGCKDSMLATLVVFSPNYKDQDNGASFYAYPNPNAGTFTYKFRISQQQTVQVKLFNILGQTPVYTATWENAKPGNYFETIDLKKLQLSKGTYPLLVFANGKQYLVKIVYLGD